MGEIGRRHCLRIQDLVPAAKDQSFDIRCEWTVARLQLYCCLLVVLT